MHIQAIRRVSPASPRLPANSGRTIAAVLGFLILFAILVILASRFYLIPAMEIARRSDHAHRRLLAARSLLLMSVLLTILLVGLLMTFRISRFFFPPQSRPRVRTKVVDAWLEAGKRLDEKPKDPPSPP